MTSIYINHAGQGDIPAVLRQLAADIESGILEDVRECAIVLELAEPWMVNRIMVSYGGCGDAGPSAHLLLCKGAAKIAGAR
jgi:hypothetical protein